MTVCAPSDVHEYGCCVIAVSYYFVLIVLVIIRLVQVILLFESAFHEELGKVTIMIAPAGTLGTVVIG